MVILRGTIVDTGYGNDPGYTRPNSLASPHSNGPVVPLHLRVYNSGERPQTPIRTWYKSQSPIMYNPYASAADATFGKQNLQHPQPQHVQSFGNPQQQGHSQFQQHNTQQGIHQQQKAQSQYGTQFSHNFQQQQQQQQQQQFSPQFQQTNQQQYPQGQSSTPYGDFFSDPAASMAAQFAKSSLGQSNNYIQQNFGSYIPMAGDLKYYFKVSNSYVLKKIALILFPFRHRNWSRMSSVESGGAPGTGTSFAPASEDINAPDLYIPLMSFVTYILLWASFSGLKGDFHPEVFGYLASQTLACSFLDIAIFKVGLYLLNCSSQASFWDLLSFSGYKYVTIIVLLCWKQLFGSSWILFYGFLLCAVGSLSLFLMRSLRFLILPIGINDSSAASISNSQRRIRVQFLFVYSVVVQFFIVLFMCR